MLNLTQNGIGEAGYLAVAEALRTNASLTHLVLDRNRMPTAPVYQAFTDVLATTNTTLSKLTLANASKVACAVCGVRVRVRVRVRWCRVRVRVRVRWCRVRVRVRCVFAISTVLYRGIRMRAWRCS